eukprot:jgi/Tetstr1/443215/TSEL_031255.t1
MLTLTILGLHPPAHKPEFGPLGYLMVRCAMRLGLPLLLLLLTLAGAEPGGRGGEPFRSGARLPLQVKFATGSGAPPLFGTRQWENPGADGVDDALPSAEQLDDDGDVVYMSCRAVGSADESDDRPFTNSDCARACNSPDSGPEDCPAERCQCELDPGGHPAAGQVGGAPGRCFLLAMADHHSHVLLVLAGDAELGPSLELLGVTAGRRGPRQPTLRLHDIRMAGGQKQLRLSRDEWRRDSGSRDDGEWVGRWTLCVSAAATGRDPPLAPFSLAAYVSRCPTSEVGRVCTGHGSCEAQPHSCAPPLEDQICHQPVCVCEEGWRGQDCSTSTAPPGAPAAALDAPPAPPAVEPAGLLASGAAGAPPAEALIELYEDPPAPPPPYLVKWDGARRPARPRAGPAATAGARGPTELDKGHLVLAGEERPRIRLPADSHSKYYDPEEAAGAGARARRPRPGATRGAHPLWRPRGEEEEEGEQPPLPKGPSSGASISAADVGTRGTPHPHPPTAAVAAAAAAAHAEHGGSLSQADLGRPNRAWRPALLGQAILNEHASRLQSLLPGSARPDRVHMDASVDVGLGLLTACLVFAAGTYLALRGRGHPRRRGYGEVHGHEV